MNVRDPLFRALAHGARRSWEACSLHDEPPLPVRLWRRGKWWLVGAALLLLELLVGSSIGSPYGL